MNWTSLRSRIPTCQVPLVQSGRNRRFRILLQRRSISSSNLCKRRSSSLLSKGSTAAAAPTTPKVFVFFPMTRLTTLSRPTIRRLTLGTRISNHPPNPSRRSLSPTTTTAARRSPLRHSMRRSCTTSPRRSLRSSRVKIPRLPHPLSRSALAPRCNCLSSRNSLPRPRSRRTSNMWRISMLVPRSSRRNPLGRSRPLSSPRIESVWFPPSHPPHLPIISLLRLCQHPHIDFLLPKDRLARRHFSSISPSLHIVPQRPRIYGELCVS
ncbi:hypothetical protein SCHPADRAFT_92862 [Schizopora paradoxa]|uniref:Uncharacterized protein n=1 Tax=Schizopora paradoxa TaxID=27342 RepID=A0A0H2SB20_9AGAM|nr:hypothetical protein SCHPADRAFT_92862 [Schizopora paradoxa]